MHLSFPFHSDTLCISLFSFVPITHIVMISLYFSTIYTSPCSYYHSFLFHTLQLSVATIFQKVNKIMINHHNIARLLTKYVDELPPSTVQLGMYQNQNQPKTFGLWVLGFGSVLGFGALGFGSVLGFGVLRLVLGFGFWVFS